MPINQYTAETIQSISRDEMIAQEDAQEFREYLSRKTSTPGADNSRVNHSQVGQTGQANPGRIYRCLCGMSFVADRSKHIRGIIFKDSHGNAVEKCPKCDRVLGGEIEKKVS